MKKFAAVNHLRFNQEARNRIRELKSTVKSLTAGERCCAALRKEELDEAILQGQMISHQSSAMPLGQGAARRIQPQLLVRKVAPDLTIVIILPLKKVEKPPGCISSYGTVSLTSLVAITLSFVHRRPSASHTRKRGGGHVFRRCFTLQ